MKVVYVCAPFRASTPWRVEQNVRRAEEAAFMLWGSGFAVICPHANTRYFDKSLIDEAFLKGDLAILKRCDAVFVSWSGPQSEGMIRELAYARRKHIPIFRYIDELITWSKK